MGRRIQIILLIVLAGCLPFLQLAINTRREKIIPTQDVYLAITPGEFAGTLMLGGFRGIAVDVLWLRAQRLQQEQKFFELIALSDMIARLQPHDRMVWEFNAWNRAYNVSVKFTNREDRWKWVKSGLDLNLQGIRRLPNNWKMYKHMAFMFMHKCADYQEETLRDFGKDNYTLAREYYTKTLELNEDAPLFINRAIIHTYEEQGEFETAKKLYDAHLKEYPFDITAKQNRDSYIREKEQYQFFIDMLLEAHKKGDFLRAIEIYDDHIFGEPYLLKQEAITAVLESFWAAGELDRGIHFMQRRMNMKMEDADAMYAEYDVYEKRYNDHYLTEMENLALLGRNYEIIAIYREKFDEKKVEISLSAGIIVLESMLDLGALDDARDLLINLKGIYDPKLLIPYGQRLQALENREINNEE